MGFSLRTLRVLSSLGLGSSALAFALCEAAATSEALVSTGALWRYHDGGTDLGTSWRDPGFDDSSWAAGPAELGFGEGDEATVVDGGPSGNRHITTYFRHGFSVEDPESIEGLTLALRRDDGAVVYLNGVEILRSNLPAGPIQASTLARDRVGGADEDTVVQEPLNPCFLVAGQNVLAVEVHQESDSSGDLSFDLSLETAPLSLPVLVRPPYLQLATPTGLVVRWRTDVSTESVVRLGPSPDSLSSAVSGGCTTEHQIAIGGLTPATRQYYAVVGNAQTLAGADPDHWFEVPPLPGPEGSVRILAMGDSGDCAVSPGGCENAAAVQDAYLAVAAGDPADVLLLLGDNAYVQGTDRQYTAGFFQPFTRVLRNSIVWPAPGNHEFGASDSPTQSGPYYDAFTLPTQGEAGGVASGTEAYYSFDRGDVHFVSIDSHDTDRSLAGPLYAWLETDLAATQREWVIVYWHHPPYTHSSHDSDDPSDSNGKLVEMRERFVPLLEAHGVDLQLAGHSHSYERSILLDGHYGFSSTYDPSVHAVDPGDGDPDGDGPYVKPPGRVPHAGTVYAVVGSSSKNGNELGAHPVMTTAIDYEGSLLVDVEGSRLDARFIDKDGRVADRFQILKPPPPTTTSSTTTTSTTSSTTTTTTIPTTSTTSSTTTTTIPTTSTTSSTTTTTIPMTSTTSSTTTTTIPTTSTTSSTTTTTTPTTSTTSSTTTTTTPTTSTTTTTTLIPEPGGLGRLVALLVAGLLGRVGRGRTSSTLPAPPARSGLRGVLRDGIPSRGGWHAARDPHDTSGLEGRRRAARVREKWGGESPPS